MRGTNTLELAGDGALRTRNIMAVPLVMAAALAFTVLGMVCVLLCVVAASALQSCVWDCDALWILAAGSALHALVCGVLALASVCTLYWRRRTYFTWMTAPLAHHTPPTVQVPVEAAAACRLQQ